MQSLDFLYKCVFATIVSFLGQSFRPNAQIDIILGLIFKGDNIPNTKFSNSVCHNNIVGSIPLMHGDDTKFSFILAKQDSTSTFDLVLALATLNESAHYEWIRS